MEWCEGGLFLMGNSHFTASLQLSNCSLVIERQTDSLKDSQPACVLMSGNIFCLGCAPSIIRSKRGKNPRLQQAKAFQMPLESIISW